MGWLGSGAGGTWAVGGGQGCGGTWAVGGIRSASGEVWAAEANGDSFPNRLVEFSATEMSYVTKLLVVQLKNTH